jgi:hypothetical protein
MKGFIMAFNTLKLLVKLLNRLPESWLPTQEFYPYQKSIRLLYFHHGGGMYRGMNALEQET